LARRTGLTKRAVTGEWTNLHRQESHHPHFFTRYYYVIKSWAIRWAVRLGEKKNTHGILVEKAEGKRPVGRHSHRREDNTDRSKMGGSELD
jgi:hypothetical protein